MQLGWIDFSSEDRRKARDVINLLNEQEAVDELGIGIVRDAFANYFFPGTSTVQTRAKYFLIVPYVMRDAVKGSGKSVDQILDKINAAEKDCGIRLLKANHKESGIIGKRVLPKGWVERKPSDLYWNGICTYEILRDKLSISEYLRQALRSRNERSLSRLGNRSKEAEENERDDEDAGEYDASNFWNLPPYSPKWKDDLSIKLTREEAIFLDDRIQKAAKGTLLAYILKNQIRLSKYGRSFRLLAEDLAKKVEPEMAHRMKLACDFDDLVYMARVRYGVMLSGGKDQAAMSEWKSLRQNASALANVDLDAVFMELGLKNHKTKKFLCDLQGCFKRNDIGAADKRIREREMQLKGKRAKLSRTKEFESLVWPGRKHLDYRFSSARKIINDIYAGKKNV